MTRVVLLGALLMAACGGADDPCESHDGTCVGLVLTGNVGLVDQLHVVLSGVATLDGLTGAAPMAPRPLPLTTALYLPSVTGAITVDVAALRASLPVGAGSASATVRPGAHVTLFVALSPLGPPDLSPTDDGGTADLAASDLSVGDLPVADLGAPDLAAADLSVADLSAAGPDAAGPDAARTPRLMFLLPLHTANLGPQAGLDGDCAAAASSAGLSPTTWHALVNRRGHDLKNETALADRAIVLPSGAAVCTDPTLFTTTHVGPINQLADGTVVAGCVFTGFAPNGGPIPGNFDCDDWSADNPDAGSGAVGLSTGTDTTWSINQTLPCDDPTGCYVYCLEQ